MCFAIVFLTLFIPRKNFLPRSLILSTINVSFPAFLWLVLLGISFYFCLLSASYVYIFIFVCLCLVNSIQPDFVWVWFLTFSLLLVTLAPFVFTLTIDTLGFISIYCSFPSFPLSDPPLHQSCSLYLPVSLCFLFLSSILILFAL